MAGLIVFPFAQRPLGRDSRPRVATRPLAPRVAPAAVRVPDPRHIQVEIPFPAGTPQIFVHEGARQLLERRLSVAALKPVMLSVTDNCRSMISFSVRQGVLRARLHHMFLDAPPSVQEALVRYVAREDRAASVTVGRYIEQNGHRIRAARPFQRPLHTQGSSHDLLSVFGALNDKYFGGTVDALITWGRVGRRGDAGTAVARRTIKLGSYSAIERLIRVHPLLDRGWVPRYFVSYIVYHEMLHHVIPATVEGKRRNLHPPRFMEREQIFRDYDRALSWERAHIHRLLRVRTS
ncbi:MAG TPA: hypothetical protein VL400_26585 [Polyangiaceae bacterium]|nr:hypothetical protein [Polyangiaceae bacterium]